MTDNDESWDVEPCPSCGKEIAEGVEYCPHCGDAVIRSTSQNSAAWVIFGALLLIAVVAIAMR